MGVTWSSEKDQKSPHLICSLGPRALRIPNTIMHAQFSFSLFFPFFLSFYVFHFYNFFYIYVSYNHHIYLIAPFFFYVSWSSQFLENHKIVLQNIVMPNMVSNVFLLMQRVTRSFVVGLLCNCMDQNSYPNCNIVPRNRNKPKINGLRRTPKSFTIGLSLLG